MEIVRKEIGFNGVNLIGVCFEEKLYIIVKNFCEVLGINYKGQIQRIKRDEVLSKGGCKIHLPSNGGNQETNLLELDYVPIWLAGIKANQCKEEIRSFLKEFKLKVKDVLAEAFLGKRTLIQLPTAADQSEGLYLQEKDISFRVNRIEKNKKVIADAQIQIIYDCEFIINSSDIIKGRIEEGYIKNLNKDYLENGVFPTVLEIDVLNADRLEMIKKKLNSK